MLDIVNLPPVGPARDKVVADYIAGYCWTAAGVQVAADGLRQRVEFDYQEVVKLAIRAMGEHTCVK
jgi:hypothetical protein